MKSAREKLSCDESESLMRPYLEGEVQSEQAHQLDQHMAQCTACATQLNARQQVHSLLEKTYQPRRLTSMFDEVTTRKLQERGKKKKGSARGIVPASRFDDEQEDYFDEEDEHDQIVPPPEGFMDRLSSSFGAAPWWMISGAFHALLLLLVTLITLALVTAEREDTVIVTELQKEEPPEEIEKPERTIIPQPVPIEQTEVETEQQPIVTHNEVQIADHVETPDDSDAEDSNGEDGMSEAFMGGSGSVAAMGLGGGGRAGAFGRPGGAGGRLRRAAGAGGGKKTESAVDKALEWLAKHQEADGRWDTQKYNAKGKWCDTAVSGFAVLAFLGAGHTEKIGKYKDNVQRGIKWLITQQQANGSLHPSSHANNQGYTNAIAGMALAEAAAMARVPATMQAAQLAVNYGGNDHQRGDGSEKRGYRYKAKTKGDLSNTGWLVMQLKGAKVAGLQVPHGSFEGIEWFLDYVEDKNFKKEANSEYDNGAHRYGYTNNKSVTHVRTAIGCLARQFMGTPANELRGGVDWFVAKGGVPGAGKGNLYYWYYGTLCTFQQGGDVWKKWNEGLKGALLPSQRKDGDMDGSWDPKGAWSSHWGRVGQTALSALCLEVYYRYLPMYK